MKECEGSVHGKKYSENVHVKKCDGSVHENNYSGNVQKGQYECTREEVSRERSL